MVLDFFEKNRIFFVVFQEKVGSCPLENFCPPLEKSLRTPMTTYPTKIIIIIFIYSYYVLMRYRNASQTFSCCRCLRVETCSEIKVKSKPKVLNLLVDIFATSLIIYSCCRPRMSEIFLAQNSKLFHRPFNV